MIILGAGLAGLSAAYHFPGSEIYERANTVGGHAKSVSKDGFTFDEGIHVLHTSNDIVLDLMGQVDPGLQVHEREAWIYHYGTYTRYPFQANTHGLPKDVVLDCLVGFIENDFRPSEIDTYEDWLRYQFGDGICDQFMVPYSKKFWGVHPRELTTEWVSVRHPRPDLREVLAGAIGEQDKEYGVNAQFRYPQEGGFGAIAEALADSVGRGRIHLDSEVTRIDLDARHVEINGGELYLPYEQLISTLPLPTIVELLDPAPAEIRQAAGELRTNSIYVVNLGIDKPDLTSKHWIYFPEKEYSFFRISFPFNKAPNMVPEGTSSISAEIAYGNGREIDRETIVDRVIDDLYRSQVLQGDDEVIFRDTIDVRYAYVVFDQNRKPAVRTIHEYLENHGIHPCGRYGEWAYLWSDEAILSGRKTALSLAKHELDRTGTD